MTLINNLNIFPITFTATRDSINQKLSQAHKERSLSCCDKDAPHN
ncbi:hypothetical protein [Scytonema hofmannii]|nr:hypothetical protein [Scytonema hofmannii]